MNSRPLDPQPKSVRFQRPQCIPTGNGEETETLAKAIVVTVNGDVTLTDSSAISMPTSTCSALQVKGADTPPAVVDGLDKLAESKAVDERNVTVTMTVEKQEEQVLSESATEEEQATQEAIKQLQNQADTASGSNGEVKEMDFLNINITKEVTLNGAVEAAGRTAVAAAAVAAVRPTRPRSAIRPTAQSASARPLRSPAIR